MSIHNYIFASSRQLLFNFGISIKFPLLEQSENPSTNQDMLLLTTLGYVILARRAIEQINVFFFGTGQNYFEKKNTSQEKVCLVL